jgi:hypothetical protein
MAFIMLIRCLPAALVAAGVYSVVSPSFNAVAAALASLN